MYRQKEGLDADKIQVFPGLRSESEVELVGKLNPGDKLFTAVPESLK